MARAAKAPSTVMSNEELREVLRALVGGVREPDITRANTALLVVDMQYRGAHPDYGLGAKAKELAVADFLDYYLGRVRDIVIPNIQHLQATARRVGVEVVHARIAATSMDGRDSSRRYKFMGLHTVVDPVEAEILPEVGPQGDELVFSKVTESVFNSTNIDRVLRGMGISNLIITGVVTNGCVEGATRSAVELDYGTIVVEDATAALAPRLHDHAILSMGHKDAVIKSTDEVAGLLGSL